jgi:hypothetical protein
MNDQDKYLSCIQSNSHALQRERRFDHFQNEIRDI